MLSVAKSRLGSSREDVRSACEKRPFLAKVSASGW